MHIQYDLGIKRLRQESYKYCAPACIQMILNAKGVTISQNQIWNSLRQYMVDPEKWYTDPEAAATFLDNQLSQSTGDNVDDLSFNNQLSSVSKLARSIVYYKLPSMILINKGRHWVCVSGIHGTFEDEHFEEGIVSALYVADPARGNTGVQFRPISSAFFNDYFNPVAIPGTWNNKLITISESSEDIVDNLHIVENVRPMGGGTSLISSDVIELTIEDIDYFGLGRGQRLLGGGSPIDDELIKVFDLEKQCEYFILPVELNGAKLIWSIFHPFFMVTEAVLLTEVYNFPPNGDELDILMKNKFGTVEYADAGYVWQSCIELSSRFEIARKVIVDNNEYFITKENIILDSFSTFDEKNRLAG